MQLYEVYESKWHVYLVMQLVRGGTLEDMLLDGKPMKEEFVCQLTRKLLLTLKYMHAKGIVHRDLKPPNIMLQENADGEIEPVIIDFGLANVMPSDGSKLNMHCGSAGYAAPELLAKQGYDTQIDIYSVGAILYQMLSGVPLFQGKSVFEILARNRDGKIAFPYSQWAGVSPAAQDLVKSLLIRQPEKRLTPTEALNHEWLLQIKPVENDIAHIIRFYSMNGQMLSGHFMKVAESILGFRQVAANICIPLVLPVLASRGFKLDRMILNAVRFALFVRADYTNKIVTKNKYFLYWPELCSVVFRKMLEIRKSHFA